jgi:chromosome segregation ATPase
MEQKLETAKMAAGAAANDRDALTAVQSDLEAARNKCAAREKELGQEARQMLAEKDKESKRTIADKERVIAQLVEDKAKALEELVDTRGTLKEASASIEVRHP